MADEAETPPAPARRMGWQRIVGIVLLSVLLALAGALVWLDTSSGHRFLAGRIAAIAPESGLRIGVGEIEGSIYSKAVLNNLTLSDPKGEFFTAPRVELDWFPFAWLYNRLDIDRLVIPRATLHKLPKLNPSKVQGPILPDFDVRLMELSIDRLTIARPITGREQVATLRGDAEVRSGRAIIDMRARVLNGSDALLLSLDSRPDNDKFDLDVTVNAPKGGVLAAMAGLTQDANLRVRGKGGWKNWNGTAVATLDSQPAVGLRLSARSGQYKLEGSVEGQAIAGGGLVQRMTAPRLDLVATGTFENRVIDGQLSASSDAVTLNADGGIDLRGNGFDNLLVDLRLNRPGALLKNMSGQDVLARLRLDGPFNAPGFDYLLGAKKLAFGKTVLSDVRATGKGRKAPNSPAVIPVNLTAKRLDGQGDMVAAILRNFSLTGNLQLQDQKITSTPMRVRADKLNGTMVALADLKTGRYDIGLTGDINGLLIPGLGVVDVRSKVQAVPGARGAFTLAGQAEARMRRLDNGFFRTLGGGLPRVRTRLALGPDARLTLSGLTLDAPLLKLAANGYRRPDGTFHFEGNGKHEQYGPVQLTLDGDISRPAVRLVLARPLDAAGLRDVKVALDPTAAGFDLATEGQSTLGPFTGTGRILLPPGGEAVIAVDNLAVSGVTAKGEIRAGTVGLVGRLAIAGPVTGFVALDSVDGVQRIQTELNARDAHFDGPAAIDIRQGKLVATILLNPAGTAIDGTVQGRGIRVGSLQVGRLVGDAKLVDGRGTVNVAARGQGGRLFDIQVKADVAPGKLRITGGGTLDRKPIRIANAAILTAAEDGGWRLSPTTITYLSGSAQFAGQLGGPATHVEARLNKMPLSVLDIANSELGLGGTATGTLEYEARPGGVPSGNAELRIRGLTRSGLALSSRPVDLGLNAALTADRLAARAVVVSQGKTVGQAQVLLSPLGDGALMERLRTAPMFGQLRYNGPADTLWRLTGIEIIDLAGPVAMAADIRGTMADPTLTGTLATDNVTIDSPITGMRLTGVKARGRFSGSQLVIASFSGNARGGGTVTGTGRFDFAGGQGVAMDLAMQANSAALLERDDIAATVTGPITITSTGVGGTIGGDLDLVRSRFTMGRAAAVAAIPELRIIEVNRRGEEFERPASAAPWALALKARARNRLSVTGMGLDSEWRANLEIGGTVTNPAIKGTAELVRGGYEFAGRRFELTEGMIRFDGSVPVNPTLDIQAEADVSDISATIKVGGTSLQPDISFTSVPALPEDELLSRILFGTSITQLSAPEALQLASAVAALQGGGGGLDPINAVRKATGLDRLRILPADTTTGQGTSVAAGKYLTRKTYVELITDGQGYSATRIEYQVTRWLSLLGAVSTLGRQSVNVRVSKDY